MQCELLIAVPDFTRLSIFYGLLRDIESHRAALFLLRLLLLVILRKLQVEKGCEADKLGTWVDCLSAALAKSGPLDFPSEKSFLLFFAHEKGLGHMFQK